MLEILRRRLAELLTQRTAAAAARDEVLAAPQKENRDLNADERTRFDEARAKVTALDTDIEDVRTRISDAEADEKRNAEAAGLLAAAGQTGERRSGGAVVTSEPTTYARHGQNSYFLDLARAQIRGEAAALHRLQRHAKELEVELPARERRREQRAQEQANRMGLTPEQRGSMFEKRVNPNRTDGQGGYFVPPLWLVDEYIDLPRYGRVTANLCKNMDLPGGTDSINLPKVATGSATGVQTADAGAVTSTDMTDTFVTAPVRTVAGQQDIAMQLLDQSPIGFDEVVFADLQADYNQRLDIQIIAGTGLNGQHLGILNVSGINAVTYTDADPTLPEMYVPIAKAASKVATGRKLPPTAAVVLPSQWYWATSELDTTKRPLIVPSTVAWNPAAAAEQLASVNDNTPAGMLSIGLPAYLDGNLPTNLGGGTNETRLIVARFPDLYLWEGAMHTRALQEVLSGTLQVRLQIWGYSAFMPHRRPEAISVISGTGMIPAAGF